MVVARVFCFAKAGTEGMQVDDGGEARVVLPARGLPAMMISAGVLVERLGAMVWGWKLALCIAHADAGEL